MLLKAHLYHEGRRKEELVVYYLLILSKQFFRSSKVLQDVYEGDKEKMNSEENENEISTIYVGSKPLMRYVMAAMSIFLDEHPEKVEFAARGRAISRAVDAAEVLRTRYLKGILELENVSIGTDEVEDKQTGDIDRVSSINITLNRVRSLTPKKEGELEEKM